MKTQKTGDSVDDFLNSIPSAEKRDDCRKIAAMMKAATKAKPTMYGTSIVGFGHCRLLYPNGKEIDWMQVAFSPRKANITLYLTGDVLQSDLMEKLGKSACGKGCLYIKKLSDVHVPTLKKLIQQTVRQRESSS